MPAGSISLFSPSKINLFLKVLGRRSDGYHELSSLFQTIDLGDFLDFQIYHKDVLTCSDSSIPLDGTNLILKATELFRRKTGLKVGLKIHLNKNIPVQAGLGGGSSNAATTLWAFNVLVGAIATEADLREWSVEIGSDVPFFFSSGTAHCTGRGECIHSLPAPPPLSCVIVKPNIGLSTPEVYKRLALSPQIHIKPGESTFDPAAFVSLSQNYGNDLERPAFEIRPELGKIKSNLLRGGFDVVLMTGSGSAFFCLGEGELPALPGCSIFSRRFLNRTVLNWYTPTLLENMQQ
jgi:4-diphosphocytidyl-2-C-methyl-D-erythritol kinase